MTRMRGEFAEVFSAFRKARGLRQRLVAQRVGCTTQAISNWESGRYLPNEKRVLQICRALGLGKEEGGRLLLAYAHAHIIIILTRLDGWRTLLS